MKRLAMKKRAPLEVFNIAFLDIISCAFGAIVLWDVIVVFCVFLLKSIFCLTLWLVIGLLVFRWMNC